MIGDITYIEITKRCNMSCKYCIFPKENIDNSLENIIRTFSIMQYKDFSDIIILGGEPLLRFDLVKDTVRWIKSNLLYNEIRIVTNGTLLSDSILKWCKDNSIVLNISFDGILSDRDSLEINTKVKENILKANKILGNDCRVIFVYTKESKDRFENFYKEVRNWGVKMVIPNYDHRTYDKKYYSECERKELLSDYTKTLMKIYETSGTVENINNNVPGFKKHRNYSNFNWYCEPWFYVSCKGLDSCVYYRYYQELNIENPCYFCHKDKKEIKEIIDNYKE